MITVHSSHLIRPTPGNGCPGGGRRDLVFQSLSPSFEPKRRYLRRTRKCAQKM
ncbi:hypothetical protein BJX65DRAFT_271621, partial [Aspergillus insuetus]